MFNRAFSLRFINVSGLYEQIIYGYGYSMSQKNPPCGFL